MKVRASAAVVGLLLALTHASTAEASSASEGDWVAPYEFGCLAEAPCAVPWARAKHGVLDAADEQGVCTYYTFPPTFYPCTYTNSSTLGGYVQVDRPSEVVVTATVRNVSGTPRVCLGAFAVRDGARYGGAGGCVPVSSSSQTKVTRTFDLPRNLPGEWGLFVSLSDGWWRHAGYESWTGSVAVDRVSYMITPE